MAANDTLAFANFDPVTGAPTMDGFVTPDPGVITSETEPGYVDGSRMTFGGSGFPPVHFQGVKSGPFLHLAFMTRGDLTFDAEDVIVIALQPSTGAGATTARRIDVFPVYESVGADEQNAMTGGPAGTPFDVPPGVPAGSNFFIRTKHLPARLQFYRGLATSPPWQSYTPTLMTSSNPPSGPYQVMVRSWVPTTSPPNSEVCWSIELKIPIDQTTGGADWINLGDGFGLYFNVIRVGKDPAAGGTPSQGWYSTQFRFPQQVPGNILTGILDASLAIPASFYGKGLIPALQVPAGSNLGQGVRFVTDAIIGAQIGRRPAGSSTLTLGHQISGTVNNELVAVIQNTSTTDTATDVTAEFRFANWGLGPAGFTSWAKPSGLSPNPSPAQTLTPGQSNVALASPWPAASVPPQYGPPNDHQCVWVQLNSTSSVNFVQSSARRNMDFINLSEHEQDAEISGVGYPAPGGGAHHDFLLFTRARVIPVPRFRPDYTNARAPNASGGGDGDGDAPDVRYLWITEGYRRTGQTLQVGAKKTEVLDEGPGAFGFVADHAGATDELRWELDGPGLRRYGNAVHTIRVPHDGAVRIRTRLRTVPKGDTGGGTGGGHPGGTKWPWWLWLVLLLLLILLLVWLF
jgi:hypothetical protein